MNEVHVCHDFCTRLFVFRLRGFTGFILLGGIGLWLAGHQLNAVHTPNNKQGVNTVVLCNGN